MSGADDALAFDAARSASEDGEGWVVDVEGFEGPLHVLLALARTQKVDLKEISIAALAEQFVTFIEAAQALRLELAADYLVMAAWLAYLKSRLLLPKAERPDDGDLPPEELARRLAFRLRRLEAMRAAARRLEDGLILDRDVFLRGAPEGVRARVAPVWSADLYDLLKAYGVTRSKGARPVHTIAKPPVYSLEQARLRLERMLGSSPNWRRLDEFLPAPAALGEPRPDRASVTASAFAAGLELAKAGEAQLRQERAFGPIWLRGPEKGS